MYAKDASQYGKVLHKVAVRFCQCQKDILKTVANGCIPYPRLFFCYGKEKDCKET